MVKTKGVGASRMKMKMFYIYGPSTSNEEKVNKWLDCNNIVIKYILQSSDGSGDGVTVVSIWYEEGQ